MWKQCIDLKDWEVNEYGKMRKKVDDNNILNSGDGYYYATKPRDDQSRVVAKAFLPNPEQKPIVMHLDGDNTNHHKDNLQWVTRSELHKLRLSNNPRNKYKTATCEHCGIQFQYQPSISKGRFCSKQCRYAAHSRIIKESYNVELKQRHSQTATKQMKDKYDEQQICELYNIKIIYNQVVLLILIKRCLKR